MRHISSGEVGMRLVDGHQATHEGFAYSDHSEPHANETWFWAIAQPDVFVFPPPVPGSHKNNQRHAEWVWHGVVSLSILLVIAILNISIWLGI